MIIVDLYVTTFDAVFDYLNLNYLRNGEDF